MRVPGAMSGLLGGLCWLVAYVIDAKSGGALVDALTWAGVALLAIAVLGVGASLVSRSATWLRVVVAICLLALAGSMLEILRDGADPVTVDGVLGLAAVLVAILGLVRGRAAAEPPPRARPRHGPGAHAR